MSGRFALVLCCVLTAAACAPRAVSPVRTNPGSSGAQPGEEFLGEGLASFYGPGLYGHKTASGERMERGDYTAAHRSLRFGSCVRVVNESNGASVRVRVNDRGPYAGNRLMDVSETAARALGMTGRGVTRVRLYRCAAAAVS